MNRQIEQSRVRRHDAILERLTTLLERFMIVLIVVTVAASREAFPYAPCLIIAACVVLAVWALIDVGLVCATRDADTTGAGQDKAKARAKSSAIERSAPHAADPCGCETWQLVHVVGRGDVYRRIQ